MVCFGLLVQRSYGDPPGINQQDDMNIWGKRRIPDFSDSLFKEIAVRNPRSFTSVWPEAQVQVTLIRLQDVFETLN